MNALAGPTMLKERAMTWGRRSFARLLGMAALGAVPAAAQAPAPGMLMLTIFLRHDESKTVDEINQGLKEHGWYDQFPPPGVEIVSWYVMMGVGQVVTIRFAAERLREVNRVIEGTAWGGYRTEFYPTYDYRGLWEQARQRAAKP